MMEKKKIPLTIDAAINSTFPPKFLMKFVFILLILMFFLSGAAALIYEIVWFEFLELIIGSQAISLAILLTVYMGGLFFGSLLWPAFMPLSFSPLRLYAFLEAGIGIMGLLIPLILPVIMRFYVASVGYGLPLFFLRGVLAAGILLWPTLLMGGTLPIISRLFQTSRFGFFSVGWLYGFNTAGGILGTLATSFYLLRLHDLAVANQVAVSLNFFLFLLSFCLASFLRQFNLPPNQNENKKETNLIHSERPHDFSSSSFPLRLIYLGIALSGLTALGAEVVWTRLLSLSLGGTVYTFSLLLAAFLTGLALGSTVSSRLIRRGILPPELFFALTQLTLIPAIVWAATAINKIVPSLLPPSSAGPIRVFIQDFFLCGLSLWPASFCWGASFPFALASAGQSKPEMGYLVGRIYAANTAGAISGAGLISLLLMPRWGSFGCQKLFIILSGITSFIILYFYLLKSMGIKKGRSILAKASAYFLAQDSKRKWRVLFPSLFIIYLAILFLAIKILPETPWSLIAYGRKAMEKKDMGKPLMVEEGINSSVAVTSWNGLTVFHTGGRAEASNALADLRMERMLAHLPALLHPEPKKILVIGCGAGITAGTFLIYPEVQKVVICEIEPTVWQKVVPLFRLENYSLDQDPRVEIIIEDGRHFLLTSKEKYDIISSDPVHPWLKGSALLYTQEYFEMIKEKLNPNGLFSQWVPLYESDEATVKSMLATFGQVFPEGLIWSNDFMGLDYDFVLLGQKDKLEINLDFLLEKLRQETYHQVRESLKQIYFRSGLELLATYAGQIKDLGAWLAGVSINRDRNLRLQYLAGWGLYLPYRISLLELLWKNFRFPQDLFVGSERNLQALRKMWFPGESTKEEK